MLLENGKLPGELIQENYTLKYGKNSLSIQKEALKKFNSYAIIDDPTCYWRNS